MIEKLITVYCDAGRAFVDALGCDKTISKLQLGEVCALNGTESIDVGLD